MYFDLHEMQFADVALDGERLAVAGSDRGLSWSALREQAGLWAQRARSLGAGPDVPIVLSGHKQAAFFTAMAACLMLGAPFVPVDSIYPEERRRRITDLVGAPLIYHAGTDAFETTTNAAKPLAEKGLAYVLFTSGSTGEPKGVQIGRESVRLLAQWMQASFRLGAAPVFMNQAPFSFDLSMFEVFGTLSQGGTCVLNSREQIPDGPAWLQHLARERISCWVSTPSFAHQQLLNKEFCTAGLPLLDTFLFCGEVLPHALCRRLKQRFPQARILNTYGPTEATVATTLIEVDQAVLDAHPVLPVGYAKPDCEIEIHDGEICIVGEHVMRGYLNQPELNQARMFRHPNGRRGLRTGDLGRLDDDGLLWCLGRRDDQVKLNGYRIELSEISLALQALDEVKNAICLALRRPDHTVVRLIGFVEMVRGTNVQGTNVRGTNVRGTNVRGANVQGTNARDTNAWGAGAWTPYPAASWKPALERRLPSYMLPSEVVTVDAFPMSVNHKIDGKALLEGYLQNPKQ
ncbi:AMP-binding protein [Candidimonas nitroreducens]|uniref:D-alanine--poly(Phosphoribitol) ligase n=1 Tax=Candidimonas nitroreducens TaxID=683354 RepID=A0A225M1L5_9BURK|nr:AMP-binding protein [Candidimonas nitroreducens]OWT55208.1 D-alanine--poly(phosphoribitol) ligase [Candidimonas nitroreducens]